MSTTTKQRRSSARLKSKSTSTVRAPYICALCNKGFTRKATVKDPHFPSCVGRRGNPDNKAWVNKFLSHVFSLRSLIDDVSHETGEDNS